MSADGETIQENGQLLGVTSADAGRQVVQAQPMSYSGPRRAAIALPPPPSPRSSSSPAPPAPRPRASPARPAPSPPRSGRPRAPSRSPPTRASRPARRPPPAATPRPRRCRSPAACCRPPRASSRPPASPAAQTATAAGGIGALSIAGLPIPLQRPDTSALPGPQDDPGRRDDRHPSASSSRLVPDELQRRAARTCAPCAPRRRRRCVGGAPQLTGTSAVAGISVLGKELPVDRVTLADGQPRGHHEHRPVEPQPAASSAVPGADIDRPAGRSSTPLPTISVPATARCSCASTPGRKTVARRQADPARARRHAHRRRARTSSTSPSARRRVGAARSTAAASPTSRCSARRARSC